MRKEKKEVAEKQKAADDAVRAARRAAEKDPSLLERVTAAEAAGVAAVAKVRDSTYDLKIPLATVGPVVGAKRKAAPAPLAQVYCLRQ